MDNVNSFYSTYCNGSDHHEYDLLKLRETTFRGFSMGFSDGNGRRSGGESINTATKAEDYDDIFFKEIVKLKPVYKVQDFLDYHFEKYKLKLDADTGLFLKHIRYVIYPRIERGKRKELAELVMDWTTKNNAMLLNKHLKERADFLSKAYELALKNDAEYPLFSDIDPYEVGLSLSLSVPTVNRIISELVQEGFLHTDMGMQSFNITQKGLKHLNMVEVANTASPEPSIHVTVGDNSQFQFQNGTVNSQQNINIRDNEIEDYKKLAAEIRYGFDEIKAYLTAAEAEDLEAEIAYMENNLQRESPNKNILKTIGQNVMEIVKAVPGNVIANIISSNYFGMG